MRLILFLGVSSFIFLIMNLESSNGNLYNNADSFGMAFDAAWKDFDLENLPKTLLNTDKIRNLVNFEMHPTEKGHRRLAEYLTRRIKC